MKVREFRAKWKNIVSSCRILIFRPFTLHGVFLKDFARLQCLHSENAATPYLAALHESHYEA